MAKEKTDATSLFSAMNKNRAKVTAKVKKSGSDIINDSVAQDTQNAENSNKDVNSELASAKTKENKTTKLVNELFDGGSNITDDIIEKERPGTVNTTLTDETDPISTENRVGDADSAGKADIEASGAAKNEKGLQHIHIALPKDVFDKLEIAKKAYYNNKTTYIRNLILDDYEKNKDYYDKLPNIR